MGTPDPNPDAADFTEDSIPLSRKRSLIQGDPQQQPISGATAVNDAGQEAQLDPHAVPPALSAKEEKEERRKMRLQKQIYALQGQIAETTAKAEEMRGKLKSQDAHATVKAHINLLHRYNEIRDVGMGLFGLIADRRGVRVKDVFEEFGIGEED